MFYVIFFLSVFLSVILQATFFTYYNFLGVKPDIIMISIVSVALLKGSNHGASWGFALGLLEDFFVGRFVGSNALAKMLTGFFAGQLEKNIFKDNPMVPFVCTFCFTIINGLCMLFLLNAFRYQHSWFTMLRFPL